MQEDDAADRPLLLELAKDAFTKQIAQRVRSLARSYVEGWMRCEFWLYPAVVQRHRVELHAYKAVILEVLEGTSVDHMLAVCRATRPDLADLWSQPAAREKLAKEIERASETVRGI